MVLLLLLPLLWLCWELHTANRASTDQRAIISGQHVEQLAQAKAQHEATREVLQDLSRQFLLAGEDQRELFTLLQPFVTSLADGLQLRMDQINAEMQVLTTRVEVGPGKRMLRVP